MFAPFDQPAVWHVVFHPGRRWWARRFCHVSLAGYFEDTWVHLDLQREGVAVGVIFKHDEVEDYLSFLLAHHAVIRMPDIPARAFFGRPMTCVSFVKHVLKVRSGALRPDGLFRDLLRNHGGVWINESTENRGDGGTESAASPGEAGERRLDPELSSGTD